MGHTVLTVEPFYDNILRIHKAVSLENITNKIILIQNAISNKRNEIKQLEKNPINIGGQGLLSYKDTKFQKDESNKYLVETILFDDLLDFLPDKEMQKTVIKIDIEGFEPYAFQYSKKVFKKLDVQIIYMEWGKFGSNSNHLIREMLNFLYAQNFKPYSVEKGFELSRKDHQYWPWDIVWKK